MLSVAVAQPIITGICMRWVYDSRNHVVVRYITTCGQALIWAAVLLYSIFILMSLLWKMLFIFDWAPIVPFDKATLAFSICFLSLSFNRRLDFIMTSVAVSSENKNVLYYKKCSLKIYYLSSLVCEVGTLYTLTIISFIHHILIHSLI